MPLLLWAAMCSTFFPGLLAEPAEESVTVDFSTVAKQILAPAELQPWETELKLGNVTFETSAKTQVARDRFLIGLKALHSFWYDLAIEEFQWAIENEGEGGFPVASALQAFAYKQMIWNVENCTAARESLDAIDQKRLQEVTPREQRYVSAVKKLFTGPSCNSSDEYQREMNFTDEMGTIWKEFDDVDALSFYALGYFAQTQQPQFGPNGTEHQNGTEIMKEVRDLLKQAYLKMPEHPGVLHYTIHAYDTPNCTYAKEDDVTEKNIDRQGLIAAEAYPLVSKSAPHALHMPSHIWLRIGNWSMSEASNFAAMSAGRKYLQDRGIKFDRGITTDMFHAAEYIQNDYLQQNKMSMAGGVLQEINNLVDQSFIEDDVKGEMYFPNLQYRMRARYVYESGDYGKGIEFWGQSMPGPLVSEDMTDGDFYWSSMSEAGALQVTAMARLSMQIVDNSRNDTFFGSVTIQEIKKIEARLKSIVAQGEKRNETLMPYVRQALHLFEQEASSMSAIASLVRCVGDDPCPMYRAHIHYDDFHAQIRPALKRATEIQDGMEELPTTPTLLLVPSYEWYGLALNHCADADAQVLEKQSHWKCVGMSEKERQEMLAEAERQFLKSLDRRAGRLISIYNLALAQEAQGKLNDATAIYSKFLEVTADGPADFRRIHAQRIISMANETASQDMSALIERANLVSGIPGPRVAPKVGKALRR